MQDLNLRLLPCETKGDGALLYYFLDDCKGHALLVCTSSNYKFTDLHVLSRLGYTVTVFLSNGKIMSRSQAPINIKWGLKVFLLVT